MVATTASTMPGEVYLLRKIMLKTRDLLRVFSPAYSKHSLEHHHLQGDKTTPTHEHVIPSIRENATNATEGIGTNLSKVLLSFVDKPDLSGHVLLPDSSLGVSFVVRSQATNR